MRADIRQDLEKMAALELDHNGNYVALISASIVKDNGGDWSPNVQLQFHPDTDRLGMVEVVVRDMRGQEQEA